MSNVDKLIESLLNETGPSRYKRGDHLELTRDDKPGNVWHGVVTEVSRGVYDTHDLITMKGRWSTGPRSASIIEVFADEPGLRRNTDPRYGPV